MVNFSFIKNNVAHFFYRSTTTSEHMDCLIKPCKIIFSWDKTYSFRYIYMQAKLLIPLGFPTELWPKVRFKPLINREWPLTLNLSGLDLWPTLMRLTSAVVMTWLAMRSLKMSSEIMLSTSVWRCNCSFCLCSLDITVSTAKKKIETLTAVTRYLVLFYHRWLTLTINVLTLC